MCFANQLLLLLPKLCNHRKRICLCIAEMCSFCTWVVRLNWIFTHAVAVVDRHYRCRISAEQQKKKWNFLAGKFVRLIFVRPAIVCNVFLFFSAESTTNGIVWQDAGNKSQRDQTTVYDNYSIVFFLFVCLVIRFCFDFVSWVEDWREKWVIHSV